MEFIFASEDLLDGLEYSRIYESDGWQVKLYLSLIDGALDVKANDDSHFLKLETFILPYEDEKDIYIQSGEILECCILEKDLPRLSQVALEASEVLEFLRNVAIPEMIASRNVYEIG